MLPSGADATSPFRTRGRWWTTSWRTASRRVCTGPTVSTFPMPMAARWGEESTETIQAVLNWTPTSNFSAKFRYLWSHDDDGPAAGMLAGHGLFRSLWRRGRLSQCGAELLQATALLQGAMAPTRRPIISAARFQWLTWIPSSLRTRRSAPPIRPPSAAGHLRPARRHLPAQAARRAAQGHVRFDPLPAKGPRCSSTMTSTAACWMATAWVPWSDGARCGPAGCVISTLPPRRISCLRIRSLPMT